MLESRSAYGFYGAAGGYTGEVAPVKIHTTRMAYREYKLRWADHKTVYGSYDPDTKTIEVMFTAEEMAAKTNLGNRYHLESFYFQFGNVKRPYSPVCEFKAKNRENAERNAKAYARQFGYVFEREATFNEYCKAMGWSK